MREIVLDTETTGLDFKSGDRIIEVGCLELINHVATGKKLQFYCSTEKKIHEGAAKIHGLTNSFLRTHPSFKEQSTNFLDFIKNDILIIHNASFDVGFINNELRLIGLNPLKNKIIDTITLAKKNLNTRTANLDYLCRRFSINLSKRILHGALLDCELLAEVYLELIGGKQIALKLAEFKQNTEISTNNKKDTKPNINKIKVSEEEIKSHKSFVKNLKNAYWNKLDY